MAHALPQDTMLDGWRPLAWIGVAVGVAAFVGALVSQYGFGWYPCPLCLMQRYPYAIGLPLGAAALLIPGLSARLQAALLGIGAAAFAVGAGLAVFHSGVEFGWWEGLASCGGRLATEDSLEAFLNRVETTPTARCDERTPFFLGLSMANWNLLVSADVAGLLGWAAWRRWTR